MTNYASKKSKKQTSANTKAYQRDDKEDRTIDYRNYRREIGSSLKNGRLRRTPYTSDVDQIEYIFHKNEVYPVALLELTRYDFDEYDGQPQHWAKYRSSILDRYFIRDAQGKFCQKMASLLNVGAWIVLYRNDLESYWLYDMTDPKGLWEHKNKEEYTEWLVNLKTDKLKELEAINEQN